MRAMPACGAIVVGVLLARLHRTRRMGPVFFASLTIFGASVVVFSLSQILWLSLAALTVYGASDMVSVYIRQSLVQVATPPVGAGMGQPAMMPGAASRMRRE